MAYDLHGSWEKVTGHHTALVNGNDPADKLTVTYAVNNWIKKGDNIIQLSILAF